MCIEQRNLVSDRLTKQEKNIFTEDSFLDFIELLSDAVLICRKNKITGCNKAAISYFKFSSPKDLMAIGATALLKLEDNYFSSTFPETIENHRISLGENYKLCMDITITPLKDSDAMVLVIKNKAHLIQTQGEMEKLSTFHSYIYYFMDKSPSAIFIYSDNIIKYVNIKALEFLGVKSKEELLGKDIREEFLLHEDYIDIISQRVETLNNSETTLPFIEQKLLRKNGKIFDAEVAASSFIIEGKMNHMLIARDITLKKQLENETKRTKELYENLLKLLPDGVFVSLQDKFHFVNDSGMKLFGCKAPEDILGKSITDFVHPEDIGKILGRRAQIYNQSRDPEFVEHRIVHDNGRVISIEAASVLIDFEEKQAVLTVARDITERKIYEQVLRESEERYRRLIELLPDGVFIVLNDSIVWGNQTSAKLLGFNEPSELVGRTPMEFLPEFIKPAIRQHIDEILENNCTSCSLKHKLYRQDGLIITVESISTTFYLNSDKYIMTVFRDLSERLKLEEYRRKADENRRLLDEVKQYDRLKTEFFANLSHEVRTPLNVILSSIQLISRYVSNNSESSFTVGINRHLVIMKQNCNRLLRLFNNLIDITRIDSGFIDLDIRNYNIVNLVEETALSVAEYIENKGISLIFDTEVEEKIMALDADKMERIILNLLSNATKFTNPGGSINVNIREVENYLFISVKDTGVGIPEDRLEAIFERFVQVDKSFTRRHEGSGIGLSIVKSLVELLGGAIEVKSKINKGSEFIVKFPVTSTSDEEVAVDSIDKLNLNINKAHIEFSDI